jgi:hypothetical protein
VTIQCRPVRSRCPLLRQQCARRPGRAARSVTAAVKLGGDHREVTTRTFARDLRLRLWREHLDRDDDNDDVDDLVQPQEAFAAFRRQAEQFAAWHRGGRAGPRPPDGYCRTGVTGAAILQAAGRLRALHGQAGEAGAGPGTLPHAGAGSHTLRHLASHSPYTPKMIRPTAATIRANTPNGWSRSVFSAVSRPPALAAR